jgi:hypothetical protein
VKGVKQIVNDLKFFKFRPVRKFPANSVVAAILIGFLTIHIFGCGNSADNNMEFTKIAGHAEALAHKAISGPSLTLALKKEIHFPYLEVEARLAPPFELPRRLQGGILRFRVQSVKMQGDLDIYDQDHFFEKGMFANVVWLNFDERQGLWSGTRQVYLSDFRTTPLKNITAVEGTMILRLPVDPVTLEFNLNDYDGRYEVEGVRFEIEHLSSKKAELFIFGSKENYMGMDVRVKGRWLLTLGRGGSFSKTSNDEVITEEHRISVNFPQPVEAIKLYFCANYTSVESDIVIQPDSIFTKNLE